jgi:hypothetical protein
MVSTPANVAAPNNADAPQAIRRLCPLASMTEATVNPSGILCRKMAKKIIHPSPFEKPGGDGNSVKESVDDQTDQYGISFVSVSELLFVGFFAEMEVWSDGVFEKVDDQVTQQNQICGVFASQSQAGRKNLY